MTLVELAFPAMGTQVRLLASAGAPLQAARALVEDLEARLSRFDPGSELSLLNEDPREAVPASPALRDAVRTALAGAAATGGLADPTLLGAVVRAGYSRSLVGRPRADLAQALAAAPPARAGAPSAAAAWRRVTIDDRAGTVIRPPGIKLDVGGSAKGFAADRAAALLAPYGPCAADVGGDMRVHGTHPVLVHNPLADTPAHPRDHASRNHVRRGDPVAHVLELRNEAVATSGIDRRLWWERGHVPAHHLLDPATGRPAWTGVLTATARAPSAALAEALAKAAVLAGPAGAPAVLARYGGVVIAIDGGVTVVDRADCRVGQPQAYKFDARRCAGVVGSLRRAEA